MPDQGIAVRNGFLRTKALLRAVIGVTFVVALALSTQAKAADDDDEDSFEEKFMKSLFPTKPAIDYRERSPLVVPPTSNLPAPETEKSSVTDPAWPKDADVRAKKAKKRDQRDLDPRDRQDTGRALNPQELAGRGPRGSGSLGVPDSRSNMEDVSGRPLSPSQLGSNKSIFSSIFSSKDTTEIGTFTGEPPRGSLTEPPKGYLTPSPNYPYGITPSQEAAKPLTPEQRAVGRE